MKNIKATFYRIGNMHIAFKGMMQELGWDYVCPSQLNKTLTEFGYKHSPESACLPFKLMLSNFKETFDRGANVIVTFMPRNTLLWCRYDDYFRGIENTLSNQGFDFQAVYIGGGVKNIYKEFKNIDPYLSIAKIGRAITMFYVKFRAVEFIEKCDMEMRPHIHNKIEVDNFVSRSLELIDKSMTVRSVRKAEKFIENQKERIMKNIIKKETLKLIVIGDIFSTSDPFASHDFIRKLGNIGVSVTRPINLSDLFMTSIPWSKEIRRLDKYKKVSKKYVSKEFGGTGMLEIGAVSDEIANHDGIVHSYVFTCMPEMAANKILEKISKDYKKPILTLVFDEHTSDAGLITRLEAYVDLLKEKKQRSRG